MKILSLEIYVNKRNNITLLQDEMAVEITTDMLPMIRDALADAAQRIHEMEDEDEE